MDFNRKEALPGQSLVRVCFACSAASGRGFASLRTDPNDRLKYGLNILLWGDICNDWQRGSCEEKAEIQGEVYQLQPV